MTQTGRGGETAARSGVDFAAYSRPRVLSLATAASIIMFAVVVSDMPSVHISEWTKEQLNEVKEEEDHGSFDSVIRILLKESDRA